MQKKQKISKNIDVHTMSRYEIVFGIDFGSALTQRS